MWSREQGPSQNRRETPTSCEIDHRPALTCMTEGSSSKTRAADFAKSAGSTGDEAAHPWIGALSGGSVNAVAKAR